MALDKSSMPSSKLMQLLLFAFIMFLFFETNIAQNASFDGNQGEYNEISWRHFGFKGEYNGISGSLEADLNLNNAVGDWYKRLTQQLKKSQWWDSAKLNIDYVCNDVDPNSNTAKISSLVSFSGKFYLNDWQFSHDTSYGQGDLGQSNIYGFVLMPVLKQSEMIEWVFRYTYLLSSENNGLKLGRYERQCQRRRRIPSSGYDNGIKILLVNRPVYIASDSLCLLNHHLLLRRFLLVELERPFFCNA